MVRRALLALAAVLLAGCAVAPQPAPPEDPSLLADALFGPPSEPATADDLFTLSEPMREFVRREIRPRLARQDLQHALLEALYDPARARVGYDASRTRNAAQAFEARGGNCLSLVVMTAAFARELGLEVSFNSAVDEEVWSRAESLVLRSGHVNVTIGRRLMDAGTTRDTQSLTVDFLGPEAARALHTRTVDERTVVAMYLNNRAAEALVAQRLDDAYAWAREAVRRAPAFASAYNTLGVVYLRRGEPARAERVFARVLGQEPANARAMSNRVLALQALGRHAEADAQRALLARIEPEPPFQAYDLGRAAAARGDWAAARDLFARELDRSGDTAEVHHWLGVAHWRLGASEAARRELALALRESTTPHERQLYAAKLAWLRSRGVE